MCLGSQKVLSSILRVCNRCSFVLCAVFFFFSIGAKLELVSFHLGGLGRSCRTKANFKPRMSSADETCLLTIPDRSGYKESEQSRVYRSVSSPFLRSELKYPVKRTTSERGPTHAQDHTKGCDHVSKSNGRA
jgi:hypothetical protein